MGMDVLDWCALIAMIIGHLIGAFTFILGIIVGDLDLIVIGAFELFAMLCVGVSYDFR